ncbi:contactin-associated protein-like 4 [Ursus americanus]|uniref:contactin-associated protein-like 4 n=1 Tax=Ursus americanus TaxID=9643 RepID=UPI001E67DBC0|nr:contactin-associated protein-like 4 [Ursus americanus]
MAPGGGARVRLAWFPRSPQQRFLQPSLRGHSLSVGAVAPTEPGRHVDEDTAQAGARGFSGCLSALQFERAAPLKAALRPGRSGRTSVQGPVTSSECGAGPGGDAAREHTHARAERPGAVEEGKPMAGRTRGHATLIGGVVAVSIFVLLCVAAVAVRLYQHRSPYTATEAEGPRKQGSSVAVPRCELGGQDATCGDRQAGF